MSNTNKHACLVCEGTGLPWMRGPCSKVMKCMSCNGKKFVGKSYFQMQMKLTEKSNLEIMELYERHK